MNKKQIIKDFSNAFGVSGFEDEVIELGKQYINDDYNISEDHLRNLYLTHKNNDSNKLSILIDAHGDEVGMIIQAIKDNGTMTFLPLGGWVDNTLPASKVKIKNKEGKLIDGIIAAKPPHFMANRDNPECIKISDMVIDVGAKSKEEVINKFKIGIAAPVVPAVECEYDESNDLFIGKAFDCRIGCAAVIDTLNTVSKDNLDINVLGTISAQEEVGERGIELVAKTIQPDIAICFEGCPADDTFQEPFLIQAALKEGPMLRHFDRSMITNPRYQKYALDLAKKHNIPVQESVRSGGGTNGKFLHTSNNGTPTIVIGIPVRYIHSHHGFTTYTDYENAVKLAVEIIKDLNTEKINQF